MKATNHTKNVHTFICEQQVNSPRAYVKLIQVEENKVQNFLAVQAYFGKQSKTKTMFIRASGYDYELACSQDHKKSKNKKKKDNKSTVL